MNTIRGVRGRIRAFQHTNGEYFRLNMGYAKDLGDIFYDGQLVEVKPVEFESKEPYIEPEKPTEEGPVKEPVNLTPLQRLLARRNDLQRV